MKLCIYSRSTWFFSSSFLVNLHLLNSFSPSKYMVLQFRKKKNIWQPWKKETIFKEKDFSCRFTLSKLKIYYLILLICVFIKSTFNPEFSRFWVMIDPVVFNDWVNFGPLFYKRKKNDQRKSWHMKHSWVHNPLFSKQQKKLQGPYFCCKNDFWCISNFLLFILLNVAVNQRSVIKSTMLLSSAEPMSYSTVSLRNSIQKLYW